ncbi:LTP_2 domain-containing protein [Cephalotus follicularis]|uniref:LTP_2 domain-containing protein n=1 Tax=Cephalotus follicularis TaxID=3775 RepID=A0A1Q3CKG1_CEPFO|nr:LTP_2 domain-containing protein [Cephalotus follicularis]
MVYLAGYLLVLFLVSGSVMSQVYIPECEEVDDILYCGSFLVGLDDDPSPNCCESIKTINEIAKREGAPKACMCVENTLKGIQMPTLSSRIESLPVKCHIKLGFTISITSDCVSNPLTLLGNRSSLFP